MKPMLKVSPLLALLLVGCASLGLSPASSFDQRLAYAVSQNAAVRQAAANSFEAGDIKADDAKSILKITDEARTLIDAARLAYGAGDIGTAEGRLQLATALLVKLQAHLRAQS